LIDIMVHKVVDALTQLVHPDSSPGLEATLRSDLYRRLIASAIHELGRLKNSRRATILNRKALPVLVALSSHPAAGRDVQQEVALALALAVNDANGKMMEILKAQDALTAMVQPLTTSSSKRDKSLAEVQLEVALALASLAQCDDDTKQSILDTPGAGVGVVKLLINIRHTEVRKAAENTLEALGLLDNCGRIHKDVFALVSLLRSDVPIVQQEAAAVLGSLAAGRRRARDAIDTGVALPRLGHLLCSSSSSPEVQQAAAEALASLARSAADDMALAMAAKPWTMGVVEKMFSSNGSASQQAGTATLVKQLALLSNMAEDIAQSQEVMKHLVAGLSSSAAAVVEATASAVEQLAAKAVNSRDHLQKLPELVARLNRVESSSDATITAAAKDAAAAALEHLGVPPERKVRLHLMP
jgi:hypothetical protein